MQDGPGTIGEHGARPRGWLSADMSTIQDIDREAARRVAMALGEEIHADAREADGSADDAMPAERPGHTATGAEARKKTEHAPRMARRAQPYVPRILALAAIVAAIAGLLRIAGIHGHGRARTGSLGKSVQVNTEDPQGVPAMKNTIQRQAIAAAVTAAVGATVNAQQAVQWRVEDGGNGHWYRFRSTQASRDEQRAWALASGAELASIANLSENEFVRQVAGGASVWIGGNQTPGACEPNCGWMWLDGTTWSFTRWDHGSGEPNNGVGGTVGEEGLEFRSNGFWNDYLVWRSLAAVLEWSADCNNDGIVDYGQILSGQLADADANGVPDACECTCDVFRDNTVNGIDLGVLLGQWGEVTQYTVTDFNRDGAVDGSDLGQLLAAWGPCPN